ncbi:MAG: Rv3654c family TadE-like protein [Mycobacterium sp.]
MSRARDETGAATVLAAIFVSAIAAVCAGGIWLGTAVIACHRAQAAADLAALVAAARLPVGTVAACGEAEALARTMGATMRSCVIAQLDATVAVSVPVGGRMGREARASARAGPIGTS